MDVKETDAYRKIILVLRVTAVLVQNHKMMLVKRFEINQEANNQFLSNCQFHLCFYSICLFMIKSNKNTFNHKLASTKSFTSG